MGVDKCTRRTRIGHFHLSSKSSSSPYWLIVALSLFICRQMNEVNGACSHAHNNTKYTSTAPQHVNVTLGEQTSVPHVNTNYHFNRTFYLNLDFQHGGLGVIWGHTSIPNPYREQPPHTSYLDYRLLKAGDIQLNTGPTENDCHICSKEGDTQYGLQCFYSSRMIYPLLLNLAI